MNNQLHILVHYLIIRLYILQARFQRMSLEITDPNRYCFSKRHSQPFKQLRPLYGSIDIPRNRLTLSLPKLVKSKKQYYSRYQTISPSIDKILIKKMNTPKVGRKGRVKAYKFITDANDKLPNEDRVIVKYLELPNESSYQKARERLYFAIFDGHGGEKCCDFLAKRMHQYIARQKTINLEPLKALKLAFNKAEEDFLLEASACNPPNKSGSCALISTLIQSKLYVANTGDSRCIGYYRGEQTSKYLTTQHSPSKKKEHLRIISNGGKIVKCGQSLRIVPGYLNVSRTIGDLNCKARQLGGLPNVIIHDPDIEEIETMNLEYLLLCSDGLIDGISREEIHKLYRSMREKQKEDSVFLELWLTAMKEEAKKNSRDNISIIIILLE